MDKTIFLELDLVSLCNSIRFSLFYYGTCNQEQFNDDDILPLSYAIRIKDFLKLNFPKEYDKAEKSAVNYSHRTARLRKRISYLLQKECLFLTLTFKDDVFLTTNAETRHKYVRRFLKETNSHYCANIDYGKLNEREHYHAIIQISHIDLNLYKYGFIFAQKINVKNELKLARYINKLTNHSLKDTTNKKIIYSRGIDR